MISVDAPAALFGAAEKVEAARFLSAGSFSLIPDFAAVVVGDRRTDDAAGGWLCCRSIGILDRFILIATVAFKVLRGPKEK